MIPEAVPRRVPQSHAHNKGVLALPRLEAASLISRANSTRRTEQGQIVEKNHEENYHRVFHYVLCFFKDVAILLHSDSLTNVCFQIK